LFYGQTFLKLIVQLL